MALWPFLVISTFLVIAYSFIRAARRPGLANIPGPFLARYTNLWCLYVTWRRSFKDDVPKLHAKYNSTLVRIGPNLVSCSDTRAIDSIYGFHNSMMKSDMVKPMLPLFKGKKQPTMFAAGDNKTHGRIRKPVAGAYAMTNVLQYEPKVDRNMKLFLTRMQDLFIKPQKSCDIHSWVQYFAFDVITDMTMSRSFGFMKAGGDVNGTLAKLQRELDYRGLTLAMPGLDDILRPVGGLLSPKKTAHFAARSRKILEDRLTEKDVPEEKGPRDFTTRFLEAQAKDSSISDGQMIGYVQANLVAGSDTTAIALRTAIYYTLKNQWILDRVRAEVDSKVKSFPIPFMVAHNELRFCWAVVREALRYHFPLISLMERLTPDSGIKLPDGHELPGETVIGMQVGLIGRDKGAFGEDADDFNPLRWLQRKDESDLAYQERLRIMERCDLSFGYGPRACLGKHVAELEIYKFIPTFFGLFDASFKHPDQEWVLRKLFVDKQYGMDMHLNWRAGKSLDNFQIDT